MKRWTVVLLTALMLGAHVGCENKAPEEASEFDREIDGPPGMIHRSPTNYDLISDPAVVAARGTGAAVETSGDLSGSGMSAAAADALLPRATGNDIQDVKRTIEKLAEAAKGADATAIGAFMDQELREVFGDLTRRAAALEKSAAALVEAARKKFGGGMPDEFKASVEKVKSEVTGVPLATQVLAAMPLDQLTFTKEGDQVVAISQDDQKFYFAKAGQVWKMHLDPKSKETADILKDARIAADKFMTTVKTGIEDGSITPENVNDKVKELEEQIMAPARGKLMKPTGAATGDALGGAAGGGAASTAPATPEGGGIE